MSQQKLKQTYSVDEAMQAYGFDEATLAANREGRLTRQQAIGRLVFAGFVLIVVMLLSGMFVVGSIFVAFSDPSPISVPLLCTLLIGLPFFLVSTRILFRGLVSGFPVESLTGEIEKRLEQEPGYSDTYYIRVGEEEFRVSKRKFTALTPGRYRIYYLDTWSHALLSFERIE